MLHQGRAAKGLQQNGGVDAGRTVHHKQKVMVPNSSISSHKLLKHTHHKHLHCTICSMQSHAADPDP